MPSRDRSPVERVLVGVLILGVDAYKATLSPLFRGSCRFDPSCSAYAREALLKHGASGIWLAFRRLLRCRPFGGFGFDPVP
jgi:putative membrane protein insertion efficiency factor